MAKYWIKNNSENIEEVFFKLGTKNYITIETKWHFTLIITLAGVDGPQFKQNLWISVLIKTGPAAKLLLWQQHNGVILFLLCRAFLVPHLKNTASIFPEIFFIQYFTILIANLINDIITFIICIIQKLQYLLNDKRYS